MVSLKMIAGLKISRLNTGSDGKYISGRSVKNVDISMVVRCGQLGNIFKIK
ncbi:hypothetical protein RSJ8_1419 [Clostridium botulinum]|nr:hypothetical protein NPD1_3293 [Clostridium botulinum]APQ69951.1 hypothetical protein RSJ8_1419 [Clostridium botulinum]